MTDTKREAFKSVRQRRYLNKDFESMRADLTEYARTHYGDKIIDLSEASMGGLLIDLAAYVGDVTSFYIDHQFGELDPEVAVETDNLERHLRRAGVDVIGAAPAVVTLSFFVEVPAATEGGILRPATSALPVIETGTVCTAENGTDFNLVEDVDFTLVDSDGNLEADYVVGATTSGGVPTTFVLRANGLAVSGFRTRESFSFGDFVPFRRVTLSNQHVSSIESVRDSVGNEYHLVGNLTEDVVFQAVPNTDDDSKNVPKALRLLPAPYRFVARTNLDDRTTTLTFGGGSADTLEDDAVPDPSLFALPLYGKTTFPRPILNPQKLLETRTLGVVESNTTLTVAYRYGGGSQHNVEPDTVRVVSTLLMSFPGSPSPATAAAVRGSTSTTNRIRAIGGAAAPTSEDLRELIPAARGSQARIVTRPDLIARIYTMPSDFGRVFRAAARPSPNNPLAAQLHIVCRGATGKLEMASDTLKDNLRTYLNRFRLTSDAIDILDARVIDVSTVYEVTVDISTNKKTILQQINTKLRKFFDSKNWHIDQPIVLSDVSNLIYNTQGVTSVNSVKIENLVGSVDGRTYSDVHHDILSNTGRGVVLPPPGGLFSVRYPDLDLIGRAI